MEISIHGNFSNDQNVNSKSSCLDTLTSLLEHNEPVLALTYKETKEVQTSFPVADKAEVAIQVNFRIFPKMTGMYRVAAVGRRFGNFKLEKIELSKSVTHDGNPRYTVEMTGNAPHFKSH